MFNVAELSKKLKAGVLVAIYIFLAILVFSIVYRGIRWVEFAGLMGKLAIISLWLVALPGILKRFGAKGFWHDLWAILKPSRRRLGVLMFLFVFIHYCWQRLFFFIQFGFPTDPNTIPVFEKIGFFCLILLIPLAITSNDFMVKKLRKYWYFIHYLMYPIVWLAALHIGLQGGLNLFFFTIPTLIIAILQIASRVYVWRK